MINLTATGGFRFDVYVNNTFWRSHSQDHKAYDTAYDVGVAAAFQLAQGIIERMPVIEVRMTNVIRAELDPTQELIEIPEPAVLPTSQIGGMDLVDFLEAIDPFDPNNTVEHPIRDLTPIEQAVDVVMRESAEASKQGSFPTGYLFKACYVNINGEPVRVGATWRGYKFVFDQRDKTAIRIGVGS